VRPYYRLYDRGELERETWNLDVPSWISLPADQWVTIENG